MAERKSVALGAEVLELVAARFRVMADPLRLRLLHELEAGEMSVNELTAAVESTQPNVSKHLRTLQSAGLVGRRQAGNTVYYAIADQTIFQMCDLVCTSLQQRVAAQASLLTRPARAAARRRR
jgi:ArsR family transcriptional regulator